LAQLAIRADTGAVVCWGRDNYGQVTPPGAVDGTSGTATRIAAGHFHTLAIVALPEPRGWLTQAAGLAFLCALRRLRARKGFRRAGPPGREASMSRGIARVAPALLVAALVFAPAAARAGLKLYSATWCVESFGNQCQGTLTPSGEPAPHCTVATGEFAAYSNCAIPQGIACNPFAPRCPFSSAPTDGYGAFHPLGGSGNPTMTSSIHCTPLSQYGAGITVRPAKGQTATWRVPPLYRNPDFFTSGGQPNRTACDARSTDYATGTQTRFGAKKGRVQRGMPVAGTSIASTTRSGGIGIFPYAIRTTGRVGQFNVQYPLIYSYTFATLRNNDATFGPGQRPGGFNLRYTNAAATVVSINVKQGAAKFGGTMRMLGSLTTKVLYWFQGYDVGSIGAGNWRYEAVGAPAPTAGGVVTKGYRVVGRVAYHSTLAGYAYFVSLVGARFPWTMGSVTVTAVGRGPHRTVEYARLRQPHTDERLRDDPDGESAGHALVGLRAVRDRRHRRAPRPVRAGASGLDDAGREHRVALRGRSVDRTPCGSPIVVTAALLAYAASFRYLAHSFVKDWWELRHAHP